MFGKEEIKRSILAVLNLRHLLDNHVEDIKKTYIYTWIYKTRVP